MKKLAVSTLLLGSLLGLSTYVNAEEANTQTIKGENSATIEVNGILGMDNTKPDAPITEGSDEWINVSVPTKTIFYGTSSKTGATIKSPEYSITNNSGRPVKVEVVDFKLSGDDNLKSTSLNLDLGVKNGSQTNLITSGVLATPNAVLGELANSEGKLTEAGATNQSKALTFNYSGTYDGTKLDNKELTANYNLVLKFTTLSFK